MKKSFLAAAAAIAVVAGAQSASAASVQVGTLSCKVEGGVGFIVGSSKGMTCSFKPAGAGKVQYYSGSIDKLGVDIGFTNETRIIWTVLAPSADVPHGARKLTPKTKDTRPPPFHISASFYSRTSLPREPKPVKYQNGTTWCVSLPTTS